jgi:peptidyl-prolyl cis-trans isomerase C
MNMASKARARHILVKTQAECDQIKAKIVGGEDFAAMARKHSLCPSGKQGGDLGTFSPGQMVPEFDQVVFRDALNTVHGPIKTQFGYHLIEITERT